MRIFGTSRKRMSGARLPVYRRGFEKVVERGGVTTFQSPSGLANKGDEDMRNFLKILLKEAACVVAAMAIFAVSATTLVVFAATGFGVF